MSTKSIHYVMKRALRPNCARKMHQANCVDLAMQAGHGIEGYKAVWYREGDGVKFGCLSDQYFQQTCNKLGYDCIKIV